MAFDDKTVEQVWQKASIVQGVNPAEWRKDQCTAWIQRAKYGSRDSAYGWEIDHIQPGASDDLANLRPLHWKNNAVRQEGRLTCPVKSNGNANTGL